MNAAALDSNSTLPAAPSAPPKSRGKRAALAGVLSLFFPGMGQLYNRQPRKALVIAIITHIFGAVTSHSRLLLSFGTMVAIVFVLIAWQLAVAAEAAYAAAHAKKLEAPIALPWLTYPVIALVGLISALALSTVHVKHESGFHALKVSSDSMWPTICAGERFVADIGRAARIARGTVISCL
jgi:TM2 domain-containing membrane protein YozV